MINKTVNQAIIEVLEKENGPLSLEEIYNKINETGLYKFKSHNPEHIVRTQLRRHSCNINYPKASTVKYFIHNNDGTFELIKVR